MLFALPPADAEIFLNSFYLGRILLFRCKCEHPWEIHIWTEPYQNICSHESWSQAIFCSTLQHILSTLHPDLYKQNMIDSPENVHLIGRWLNTEMAGTFDLVTLFVLFVFCRPSKYLALKWWINFSEQWGGFIFGISSWRWRVCEVSAKRNLLGISVLEVCKHPGSSLNLAPCGHFEFQT